MSNQKKRKKLALGKGLDALIPDMGGLETMSGAQKGAENNFFLCSIHTIGPNRFQPRIRFAEEELEELADSIRSQGIIQPILVRKADEGYELVAGERRLRAAKMAGLDTVPVIVKTLTDTQMLEMSIVENIQRSNLNPMEEAHAYHRLINEFSLTQEQAAERVGKSRSAVANFLRLRQLSEEIKSSIMDGDLSMGHARALLGLDTAAYQRAAWREVIRKKLSVRDTEKLIKRMKKESLSPEEPAPDPYDGYFTDVSDKLSIQFGTHVKISRKGKKGKVEIAFYNDDDLDRLLGLLNRGNETF